ncbi:MAG: YhcH/YjgK/YiaL family protein [Chitinophagaceae bacterium]|nr:YhcH/YjgK/YiaL family protein [Chitinophagaceae bacterium]
MITGSLSQLYLYKTIHPNLEKAIEYILKADFNHMPTGKYEIDSDEIFYMVNEYNTKAPAECEPERHRKYTDIQIMIEGEEKFGYTAFRQQQPATDFLPDNDVAFFSIPELQLNYITLSSGQFIIFFPDDIHQPEVYSNTPSPVKKVVVKVHLQGL